MLRFVSARRKVAVMTAPCPALGFRVTIEPHREGGSSLDVLVDAWTDFLEGRGLRCTGGSATGRLAFVVASDAFQATESDRVATRAWLAARPEVHRWQVGDLEDLNREDP